MWYRDPDEEGGYTGSSLLEAPAQPTWAEWDPSPYHSDRRGQRIRAIICHYTAGPRLTGTVRWFKNNPRKVSAHFVVGKDGRVVQMVPLSRAAHHAGKGRLPGCGSSVNRCSIGIEIVNWGVLQRTASGYATRTGRAYSGPAPVLAPDAQGRNRYWEPYPEAQFEALTRLLSDLVVLCPSVEVITGHQDIAIPFGRKSDPGGAFDWDRIRRALPGFTGHIGPLPRPGTAAPAPVATAPTAAGDARASRAVVLNRRYGSRLGWVTHVDRIVQLLGFTDRTPDERSFADAVARWQRARSLTPDGIIGPATWSRMRPLLAMGAQPPVAAPPPSGVARDWNAVRQAIVAQAEHEYANVWARGTKKEHQAEMRSVLLDYWHRGVGWDRSTILRAHLRKHPERRGADEGAVLSEFFVDVPWSAVFISWIMTKGGAGDIFERSSAHWRYVQAAQENRKAENLAKPIWAFRVQELSPIPGDIVVRARGRAVTWDDLTRKPTHGDVVVSVEPGHLRVIGGNLSNSVGRKRVSLSPQGKIAVTGNAARDHFAVLRLVGSRRV